MFKNWIHRCVFAKVFAPRTCHKMYTTTLFQVYWTAVDSRVQFVAIYSSPKNCTDSPVQYECSGNENAWLLHHSKLGLSVENSAFTLAACLQYSTHPIDWDTDTPIHTYIHTPTHTCIHSNTYIHAHTHIDTQIHTHKLYQAACNQDSSSAPPWLQSVICLKGC